MYPQMNGMSSNPTVAFTSAVNRLSQLQFYDEFHIRYLFKRKILSQQIFFHNSERQNAGHRHSQHSF